MPEQIRSGNLASRGILERLGIKIGHHTDEKNLTGLTCFIADQGANVGIDIRGSNTGTLNTPAYDAKSAWQLVHGIVLTGGSTFGLESAFGTMEYLEENQIGYRTRAGIVPGIAAAVIYDIAVGDGKVRPTKEDGYRAAKSADTGNLSEGNIGVGTGATVGKWAGGIPMKGGFGIGVTEIAEEILVVAIHPIHTNLDGDVIFAISSLTGEQKVLPEVDSITCVDIIGLAAADALSKAINNSVIQAKSIEGFSAYQS